MLKSLSQFKAAAIALMAVAGLFGAADSAHAGNVYLTFYYYTYATGFSTTVYPLGGTVGFGVNAYSFSRTAIDIVGSTGPNGPDANAGSVHVYTGGPINGYGGNFRTDQPYWKVENTIFILGTAYDPGPVTLYCTQIPQFIAASNVPQ